MEQGGVEQAEMAGGNRQHHRLGDKRLGQGQEVIGRGALVVGAAVAAGAAEGGAKGAGDVLEGAVAVVDLIEGNHDRDVITHLGEIHGGFAILEMLVVVPVHTGMGHTGLALEEIGAPELVAAAKELAHTGADGGITDHVAG